MTGGAAISSAPSAPALRPDALVVPFILVLSAVGALAALVVVPSVVVVISVFGLLIALLIGLLLTTGCGPP